MFAVKIDSNEKLINKSLAVANKIADKLKNFQTSLVDKNISNAANLIYFNVSGFFEGYIEVFLIFLNFFIYKSSLNEIISKIENAKPVFIK